MTPGARHAAAIGVLDRVLAGQSAEQALTNWGRASRYAGSGDRAAVRDVVFDALRCKRSFAAMGGGLTGRALVLGGLRAVGHDPATVFTGAGHAPPALSKGELALTETLGALPEAVALDCPDWLVEPLRRDLGDDFGPVMAALRRRAPLFLRVNALRATLAEAQAMLVSDGIEATPCPLAKTALQVTAGARKVGTSRAYADGLVELQDAASQALVETLGPYIGTGVLDYCAGGGGKALALAAMGAAVVAHDADAARMRDLPARADRAHATVTVLATAALGNRRFGLVLVDAPCSGSGAWRRSPEGKWALTPDKLAHLTALQRQILDEAVRHVGPGGHLAYATCSMLAVENEAQVEAFAARHPSFLPVMDRRWIPLDGGDGFHLALFARQS